MWWKLIEKRIVSLLIISLLFCSIRSDFCFSQELPVQGSEIIDSENDGNTSFDEFEEIKTDNSEGLDEGTGNSSEVKEKDESNNDNSVSSDNEDMISENSDNKEQDLDEHPGISDDENQKETDDGLSDTDSEIEVSSRNILKSTVDSPKTVDPIIADGTGNRGSYSKGATILGTTLSVVASGECGINATWVLTNDGVLKITGTGTINPDSAWEELRIEKVVIYKGIVNIAGYAFRRCTSLTNITIPEGVTSIGNNTFYGCTSLTNIIIPKGVTSIEKNTFCGCTSLEDITIPEGVTNIESCAFKGCTSLTNITIPEGVTSIGSSAFEDCTSLINIIIPEGVTSIENSAFEDCTSLTSIIIPEGVTTIGGSAFYSCTSLASITIPESTTSVSFSSITRCDSLKDIWYGGSYNEWNSIEHYGHFNIPNNAVIHYSKMDIYLSAGMNAILSQTTIVREAGKLYGSIPTPSKDGYGFLGWYTSILGETKITSSSIVEENQNTIYARWKKTITFSAGNGASVNPSTKTVILGDAYGTLPTPIRNGYAFIGWYTEQNGGTTIFSTSIVTENGPTILYAHWKKTKTVTFSAGSGASVDPSSKRVIVGDAYGTLPEPVYDGYEFLGWYTEQNGGTIISATSIVQENEPDILYAHWRKIKIIAFSAGRGASVNPTSKSVYVNEAYGTLPEPVYDGYEFLGWYTAKSGGTKITSSSIVQENSVSVLYAHWCRTVTFSAGSGASISTTSKRVTVGNAYGTLPTPTLYDYEFLGWYTDRTGGTKITASTVAQETIPAILYAQWNRTISFSPGTGANVDPSEKVVMVNGTYGALPEPQYEDYVFEGWFTESDGGTEITPGSVVPENNTGRTLYAHWNMNLRKGSCGTGLFWIYDATRKTLTISGNGVMNDYAKADDQPWKSFMIEKVIIKEGVTSIGDKAFMSKTGIEEVVLPNSLRKVGDRAFLDCADILSIDFPDNVSTIGDFAFARCTGLANVAFPENLTGISEMMFYGCTGLKKVELPTELKRIEDSAFSGCSDLEEVVFSNRVEFIGSLAFFDCRNLIKIEIPDSVKEIETGAFLNCSKLKSAILPAGISCINDNMFGGCSKLEAVTIPRSVSEIGNSAFILCSSLKDIIMAAVLQNGFFLQ